MEIKTGIRSFHTMFKMGQKGATVSISLDNVVHTKKKDSHNIGNGFEATAFDLTRLTNATDYVLHS